MRSSKISHLFSFIYNFIELNKVRVLFFFVGLILFSAYGVYNLKVDNSIQPLMPQGDSQAVSAATLLDLNPASRVLLVEISSSSPENSKLLASIASKVESSVEEFLLPNQFSGQFQDGFLPVDPISLLNLIPALYDESMDRILREKTFLPNMKKSIAGLKNDLTGAYGFAPKAFIKSDPLNFLSVLKNRFPVETMHLGAFGQTFLSGGKYPVSANGNHLLMILKPKAQVNDTEAAKTLILALQSSLDKQTYEQTGRKATGHMLGKIGDQAVTAAGEQDKQADEQIKTQVSVSNSNLNYIISGGMRYTAENAITIERDLKLTITLSLCLIALIFVIFLRSWGAIWIFLTPLAAVLLSVNFMSFLWPQVAGLALGLGAVVLGLAEDYAVIIHFALRKNPQNKSKGIGLAARPVFFSAILCMSSFLVLTFSNIPALREMGFFAACSLLAGLIIALIFLPHCPGIDKPYILQSSKFIPHNSITLRTRPFLSLSLGFLLLVGCILGFCNISFDSSVQGMGARTSELQEEMQIIRNNWQAGSDPEIWASGGASLNEALENSARLKKVLSSKSQEGQIFSLSDLVPPAKERQENIIRWNKFIEEQGQEIKSNLMQLSKQEGFSASAFEPFFGWLESKPNPDSIELLKAAGLGDILWWMLVQKDGKYYALSMSNVEVPYSNIPLELRESSYLLSPSAIVTAMNKAFNAEKYLFPIACAVCLVLLVVCFRRPAPVLLSCFPPLFGVAAVLTWLCVSGQSLTLPGAAALILVMGLGADYGIVMLHELSSKLSFGAFKSILVSGLTTLSGIGVLILAEHPVLHELGKITFLGLISEMLAVLVIIPFLCKKGTA